jgi:NADP-dependent 3-hydroxy acid dehydrogenase YdfG
MVTSAGQLNGKVVIVTGAGRGIGAATARLLAERGARLVLGARSADELKAVASSIDGDVVIRPTDVTRPDDVQSLVDLGAERFGRLDVFVANAGIAITAPLATGEMDDWNRMIDVNLRGVLHGIAAALPLFQRQGSGHFVTVASTSALKWVPGQGVYAATKAGVRALCEILRQELAPQGLRATMVYPGFTNTDFIASIRDPDELAAAIARRDEIAMPPNAIAEAVAFAIAQPGAVDVGEIVVRPTIQP